MERLIENIDMKLGVATLACAHEIELEPNTSSLVNLDVETLFCYKCHALNFPNNVSSYKTSKTFNQESVPKGFLATHSTKSGVWGKIIVDSGELRYVVDDLEDKVFHLSVGMEGIIAPQMLHHLEVIGLVEFHVEFYKKER